MPSLLRMSFCNYDHKRLLKASLLPRVTVGEGARRADEGAIIYANPLDLRKSQGFMPAKPGFRKLKFAATNAVSNNFARTSRVKKLPCNGQVGNSPETGVSGKSNKKL